MSVGHLMWILPSDLWLLKEAPPGVILSKASPTLLTKAQEVCHASYPALVAVASPARPVRRCLHPRRLPPLRRLGYGTGRQRRSSLTASPVTQTTKRRKPPGVKAPANGASRACHSDQSRV